MGKWRKRPVVVDAEQWIPGVNDELVESIGIINHGDRETSVHENGMHGPLVAVCPAGYGLIPTLEGPHVVSPGDWIITGVQGERYPCKPDIFAATYEPVEAMR